MERIETRRLIVWFCGFLSVCFLFFPIKGDLFSVFLPVYFYFAATLVLSWVRYLTSSHISSSFIRKLSLTIVLTATLFPAWIYFYNGRGRLICNAAEYNYPSVLNVLLDTSNKEELKMALERAQVGENWEIVNDLLAKGATY